MDIEGNSEHTGMGQYFMMGMWVAVFVILADQISKWWVIDHMVRETPKFNGFNDWFMTVQKLEYFIHEREKFRDITITPFLDFSIVWNQGVSFGMLKAGSDNMLYALIALTLLITIGFTIWLAFAFRFWRALGISFVVGGAVGNLIDRFHFEAVLDFARVTFVNFPVFNLADSFITIGAGLIMLDMLILKPMSQKRKVEKIETIDV